VGPAHGGSAYGDCCLLPLPSKYVKDGFSKKAKSTPKRGLGSNIDAKRGVI
jgi:hypothetical protein